MGTDLFEMQYMNAFKGGLDLAFDSNAVESCFKDYHLVEYRDSLQTEYAICIDWGKQIDYTVVTVVDITNKKKVKVVYWESYKGKTYHEILGRINYYAHIFKPEIILCDLGGGEKQIEDLVLTYNLNAEGIMFLGSNARGKVGESNRIKRRYENKHELVLRLNTMMTAGQISFPKDREVMQQFLDYQRIITPSGNLRYDTSFCVGRGCCIWHKRVFLRVLKQNIYI